MNGEYALDTLCVATGHILALFVRVRGEFVLVGDMLKSMSVWRLTGADEAASAMALSGSDALAANDNNAAAAAAAAGGSASATATAAAAAAKKAAFRLIAVDYTPNWLSAIELLSDDVYLGAEDNDHLLTLRRNDDAPTDEERARLDTVGVYHLGEFVNVFRKGKKKKTKDRIK